MDLKPERQKTFPCSGTRNLAKKHDPKLGKPVYPISYENIASKFLSSVKLLKNQLHRKKLKRAELLIQKTNAFFKKLDQATFERNYPEENKTTKETCYDD